MQGSAPPLHLVRFGVFEVDLRAGELRKSGLKVRVQEKPFQVLEMLLEHPGEIVTREELQKKLWPENTFVDFDHSMNTAVTKLREALGDTADNPRFVETLARRGYRFIAPVVGAGLVPAQIGRPQGAPLRRRWIIAAGTLVAIVVVFLALNVAGLRERLLTAVGARPTAALPKIESIAVLPLENLSHDPEQEYFADGMTDELITNLGKIRALRVISRTTAMHFKGSQKTLPEIARELKVDAVVEGSVLRSGNRVRITANLLQAATDRHLWAESYERDLRDTLALQSDVAQAIAHEIQVKLTPQEQTRLASARPVNPEAYQAYLKGRYYWNRWPDGLERSVEYFQEAIKQDPRYAPAYAGLALCYSTVGFFQPPKEVYPKLRAAAMRAVELDGTLAEAHAAIGYTKLYFDWDWEGAERAWRRALELNPNSVEALRLSSEDLVYTGQFNEGLAQARRARDLDPLNRFVSGSLGYLYMRSRHYDEAITHYRMVLELDPTFSVARDHLAYAYTLKGMHEEALAEYKKFAGPHDPLEELAFLYSQMGRGDDARRVADNLRRLSRQKYIDPYRIAIAYASLGDKDRTFAWLEKAYQDRSPWMAQLKVEAFFDPLRSDPRFKALLRRMNFPQ